MKRALVPREPGIRFFLHHGDLTDGSRLVTLLERVHRDEVYNLAAQSPVRVSFDEPEFTGPATGLGSTRLLEAIRMVGLDCRHDHVAFDERCLRPTEVDALIGDASRAKAVLDWEPEVLTADLARIMVEADLAEASKLGLPESAARR